MGSLCRTAELSVTGSVNILLNRGKHVINILDALLLPVDAFKMGADQSRPGSGPRVNTETANFDFRNDKPDSGGVIWEDEVEKDGKDSYNWQEEEDKRLGGDWRKERVDWMRVEHSRTQLDMGKCMGKNLT